MKIVILLPTIYRPLGLLRVLDSIFLTTQGFGQDINIVIACEEDDNEAWIWSPQLYITMCKEKMMGPAYAWNTALQYCERNYLIYTLYVLASDDIEFEYGWLDEVLRIYKDTQGAGLIGLNDQSGKYERAGFCTHYVLSREFIKKYNGGVVACPHYYTDFSDVEIIERAKKVRQFVYAKDAKLIHHHRKLDDLGYKKADIRREEMRKLFMERKANKFPDDFERIIK